MEALQDIFFDDEMGQRSFGDWIIHFDFFVFVSLGRGNNDTTYVLLNGDFGYFTNAFKDCNSGPDLSQI